MGGVILVGYSALWLSTAYFARGRGVTWLNYLSDQFAGLHAIVVPGTLRDSLIILDGLLPLQHEHIKMLGHFPFTPLMVLM